jgi:hypothetical protein
LGFMTEKVGPRRVLTLFTETFGLGRAAALITIFFIGLVTVCAAFWFVKSAPPSHIIITAGPQGSVFQTNAEKYGVILAACHQEWAAVSWQTWFPPHFTIAPMFWQNRTRHSLSTGGEG